MAKKIHVDITMDPEDKAMAISDAHKVEMTLSEYIRKLIYTNHVRIVLAQKSKIDAAIREGQK